MVEEAQYAVVLQNIATSQYIDEDYPQSEKVLGWQRGEVSDDGRRQTVPAASYELQKLRE